VTVAAAIDCGTNTINLLVATLGSSGSRGRAEVHLRESRLVRLGQDVDRTGVLAEEALARAFAAIDEYAALIAQCSIDGHPVERIRFCATSAARDASNGAVFAAGVRDRLGIDPEVVTGDEEARLAYDGVVRNLREVPAEPVLVIDIGGGSTELILGGREPTAVASMDIGAVRLHERHLHSDPPTPDQIAAATADIDVALDACPVRPEGAATAVGVAGTLLTVAAGVLDLPTYDREAIDQSVLPVAEVHAMIERLLAMTVEQRRALPYMHPGRADVIGAGALILGRVLRRTHVESLVASEANIVDGICWSLA
jgi:exopolyphosphatase/guanosine-5'-triphosphate,3'-diphosphate pyrophosphatase